MNMGHSTITQTNINSSCVGASVPRAEQIVNSHRELNQRLHVIIERAGTLRDKVCGSVASDPNKDGPKPPVTGFMSIIEDEASFTDLLVDKLAGIINDIDRHF